jgi:amidase
MFASEYESFEGLGLAALVRSGQVSPREVMACAIELARSRGASLNALCYERYEESLKLAAAAIPRGIFAAVPFLLKDSGLASTRFPSSIGSRLFADTRFKFDATLVERFDEAGLIAFARTTVPELCMSATTEAARNDGPTRNPWNASCSAGGSSGGAAAAVAAGIVPIAHGNDGGGSIRIPASCCGVFGLKPSRGRVPMGPARGEGWGGLAAEGVLSRTVRDTAAALDAIGGAEPGAPYASPAAPRSYLQIVSQSFERPLRIAKWDAAWDDIAIAAECSGGVHRAAVLLRSAGHEVIDTPPPNIAYTDFIEALIQVLAANIAVAVNSVVKDRPIGEWQDRLEPAILDGYHLGRTLSAEQYVRAINVFHSVGRRMESYMAGYDMVLSPTLTQLPARLGDLSTQTDFRSFRRKIARYTTFLAVINASGQPAASVPLHWSEAGLPVGIQLIGHFGREDQILKLAAQLEAAAPWSQRYPAQVPPEFAKMTGGSKSLNAGFGPPSHPPERTERHYGNPS